jgi:predicted ArsR family transcriptional regulator
MDLHHDERQPAARLRLTEAEVRLLAHPGRRRVLATCQNRACTRRELADAFRWSPQTVDYHVGVLAKAGLVMFEAPSRGVTGRMVRPFRATLRGRQVARPGTAATE